MILQYERLSVRRFSSQVLAPPLAEFHPATEAKGSRSPLISHSGYTDGAEKRAESAGIELRMLTLEEAERFDWDEFVQDSCQVSECLARFIGTFRTVTAKLVTAETAVHSTFDAATSASWIGITKTTLRLVYRAE